jgi:hypothetical protein
MYPKQVSAQMNRVFPDLQVVADQLAIVILFREYLLLTERHRRNEAQNLILF